MKRLVLIFIWVFISLIFFSTPLLALGSYENGISAFERGDYETALREFKFLVERKDSRGEYSLGLMYDLGVGVPTDFEEAVKWYQLSANQGNADAQNNLATMYAEGEGIERDAHKAAKLYESAAQQGNFDALNNLGTMYLRGVGVARDYVRAYMWFHLGEMKGDRAAKRNREFVETRMAPEEIIRANKLVGEWMRRYVGL